MTRSPYAFLRMGMWVTSKGDKSNKVKGENLTFHPTSFCFCQKHTLFSKNKERLSLPTSMPIISSFEFDGEKFGRAFPKSNKRKGLTLLT